MRKIIFVSIISITCILQFMTAGCSSGQETLQRQIKPVRVMEVREEIYPVNLEYIGNVRAKTLKKYSFKLSGKLERLYAAEGQGVTKGQVLAELDSQEIQRALQASFNSMETARRSYEFSQDNYEKTESLFAVGAISRQEADKAKLELDVKETSYHNARLDYENKRELLEDSRIKADMDGYVVDIFFEEGEALAAGSPVITARSSELVVRSGVAQQDYEKIRLGTPVQVIVNGNVRAGKITKIAQAPDNQTRTYEVEISIDDTNLPLGVSAEVSIDAGEEKGIYIPITSILKKERDYVFIASGGKAVKKELILSEVRGTVVRVEGLSTGDELIIEGMRNLEDGDMIAVQP